MSITKRGGRKQLVSSLLAAAAAFGAAGRADAAQADMLSADDVLDVADFEVLDDGSARVTLGDGRTVTLPPGSFAVEDGALMIDEAALSMVQDMAAADAASGAPGLGEGLGQFLLPVAGTAAAVTALAGGGGDDDGETGGGELGNTPPSFSSQTQVSVEEGTQTAFTARATDADGDTVTYAITGGDDADLFEIDAATGVVTFRDAPDFDDPDDRGGDNTYEVAVTASDGTDTTTRVTIVTVTNANDEAPEFEGDAEVEASENQTAAFTARATDADGDAVTYAITGGADAALFTIDAGTGEVSFADAPDFEAPSDADGDNVYQVQVTASDGTTDVSRDFAVTVTDEDDTGSAPTFTSPATVEAEEGGDVVFTVSADDPDGDDVTYSIVGGADAGQFTIDEDTGVVTFVGTMPPDFETPGSADGDNDYQLTIRASDGFNQTDQDVTVTITDANDNAPVLTFADAFDAAENQTMAFTASATDADGDALTFSITGGGDADLFEIDADTGRVTFVDAPDFETPTDQGGQNTYRVRITASDGENETEQLVVVTVTDVDEIGAAPVFTSADSASVAEGGTDVITVQASDDDGDDVTFAITGGADAALFTIDADTGEIDFLSAPDFEDPSDADTDNVYAVEVTATDGQNDTVQTLTVTVTDEDDEAPAFTSAASQTADEEQTAAFTATATDADSTDVTFSITGGADAALFTIDADTGAVSFAQAPDFEAPADADGDNAYEVQVTASDGTNSTAQDVTVTVADVDEAPAPGDFIIRLRSGTRDTDGGTGLAAGDLNGDGIADVVVGAPAVSDPALPGQVLVLFGDTVLASGGGTNNLDAINPGNGVILTGLAGDQAGYDVAVIGDVDGDGVDDLVIGAPELTNADGVASGGAYIVYSSTIVADADARIDLASLGSGGIRFEGGAADGSAGLDVANVGDVDGDGLDDLLVTANEAEASGGNDRGLSFLVWGSTLAAEEASGDGVIDLDALGQTDGVVIEGPRNNDRLGWAADGGGDIDGDGLADILIGAPRVNVDPGNNDGAVFVIYGSTLEAESDTGDGRIDQADIRSIQNGNGGGVVINHDGDGEFAGQDRSVAIAGDVDGDGTADILIGVQDADDAGADAGQVFLVFGDSANGDADNTVSLGDIGTAGTRALGIRFDGLQAGDAAGYTVASAGDIDGDGLADIIIGAPFATRDEDDGSTETNRGEAYVVFGSTLADERANGDGVIDLSNLGDGGVLIQGPNNNIEFGTFATAAGDIDGDGFGDVLISGARAAGRQGDTYVISGAVLVEEANDDGVLDLDDAPREYVEGGADPDGSGGAGAPASALGAMQALLAPVHPILAKGADAFGMEPIALSIDDEDEGTPLPPPPEGWA